MQKAVGYWPVWNYLAVVPERRRMGCGVLLRNPLLGQCLAGTTASLRVVVDHPS